jgi:hypothetical protein
MRMPSSRVARSTQPVPLGNQLKDTFLFATTMLSRSLVTDYLQREERELCLT